MIPPLIANHMLFLGTYKSNTKDITYNCSHILTSTPCWDKTLSTAETRLDVASLGTLTTDKTLIELQYLCL